MHKTADGWYLTPGEERELHRPAASAARPGGATVATYAAVVVLAAGVCAWSWLCAGTVPHVFGGDLSRLPALGGPLRSNHFPVWFNLEVRCLAVCGLWVSGLMVTADLAAMMHRVLRRALRPVLHKTGLLGLWMGAVSCWLLVAVIEPAAAVALWTCAVWCAAEFVLSVTVLWPEVKPWRR